VIAGLSLAGAIGIGTVGVRGDSSEFSKPRILDTRGESDKPKAEKTEKAAPEAMKPYKPEALELYERIRVTDLDEAINKGYIIENKTSGDIFPAEGLDWAHKKKVDLNNPATLTLIKVTQ